MSVAMFLRQNNYSGNITTVGRGEEEPFAVPEGMQLPQPELFRLFRRVEMQR